MIKKISTFGDKGDRTLVQNAMLKALQDVVKQFGFESITAAGYGYSDLECTFKFSVLCDSNSQVAKFKNFSDSKSLGFTKNIVGETFRDKGHTFIVKGFSMNKRNSVDCTRADGKEYGYSPSYLKNII